MKMILLFIAAVCVGILIGAYIMFKFDKDVINEQDEEIRKLKNDKRVILYSLKDANDMWNATVEKLDEGWQKRFDEAFAQSSDNLEDSNGDKA